MSFIHVFDIKICPELEITLYVFTPMFLDTLCCQDLYERGPNGAFYLVKFWADININVTDDTPGAFYAVNML